MFPANCSLSSSIRINRILMLVIPLALLSFLGSSNCLAQAQPQSNETLPLDQVRPGMQGYAYTIFAGDQVEKFDLAGIGVMTIFLGPTQSLIFVPLDEPTVYPT